MIEFQKTLYVTVIVPTHTLRYGISIQLSQIHDNIIHAEKNALCDDGIKRQWRVKSQSQVGYL